MAQSVILHADRIMAVPPAPVLNSDVIFLQREGHETLEVDKHLITPGMVGTAFDVSLVDPTRFHLKCICDST